MNEKGLISIDILKPHPKNPNLHPKEQIDKLCNSIKKLGWGRPILISKDNYILAGHAAVMAAKELGIEKVPFRRVSYMHDDAEAVALMIADNKLQEYSLWDDEILDDLISELEGFDLDVIGFEEWDVDVHKQYIDVVEDEIPEDVDDSRVSYGDVWILGEHRLLCADCLDYNLVESLFDGVRVDMVFTDPPFDFEHNDKLFDLFNRFTKDDANVFLLHEDNGIVEYLKSSQFKFKQFFVLDVKIAMRRGRNPYKRHLLLSFEQKGSPIACNFLKDGFVSIIPMDYRHHLKEDRFHDHQKPVYIPSKFVQHYTEEGMIVFDPFLGSGSTLMACEQTGRNCFGVELDPNVCDRILERWERFTGDVAVKKK